MSLIDDIKRDREAASDFHWIGETLMATDFGEVIELCSVDWSPLDELEAENKRRIARIPAMEAALLAAEELAEAADAMTRMIEDSLGGTGRTNVAIKPDASLTLNDAFKRLTAYREALK